MARKLNTLNAYSSEWGVCLDQEFIEEKTNEITAMPILLKRLDLTNTIITCDLKDRHIDGFTRHLPLSIIKEIFRSNV